VAARDLETAKALEPQVWKHNDNLAREFHHPWEKQFAVVRMDTWGAGAGAHQVVYHEYTHSLPHLNTHWLPLWLDEGLAEFYAYTRSETNRIIIGAPTERFRDLKAHPLPPVETLISMDRNPVFGRDPEMMQIFSADAWALVHYMIFGESMQGGLLNRFNQLPRQRVPQKQAFAQVFGDYASFDKAWFTYTNRLAFGAGVPPAPPRLSSTKRVLRPASSPSPRRSTNWAHSTSVRMIALREPA
jgi:hypothetical protein